MKRVLLSATQVLLTLALLGICSCNSQPREIWKSATPDKDLPRLERDIESAFYLSHRDSAEQVQETFEKLEAKYPQYTSDEICKYMQHIIEKRLAQSPENEWMELCVSGLLFLGKTDDPANIRYLESVIRNKSFEKLHFHSFVAVLKSEERTAKSLSTAYTEAMQLDGLNNRMRRFAYKEIFATIEAPATKDEERAKLISLLKNQFLNDPHFGNTRYIDHFLAARDQEFRHNPKRIAMLRKYVDSDVKIWREYALKQLAELDKETGKGQ